MEAVDGEDSRGLTCGTCDGVQKSSRSALFGLPGPGLAPTRSGGIPVVALRVWCCRCDSEHRFWKPSEVDAEVDSAAVSEMLQSRYITFAGKFEPVQHRCRAPRPDGRLCERQDRLKVRRGPGLVRATGTRDGCCRPSRARTGWPGGVPGSSRSV